MFEPMSVCTGFIIAYIKQMIILILMQLVIMCSICSDCSAHYCYYFYSAIWINAYCIKQKNNKDYMTNRTT